MSGRARIGILAYGSLLAKPGWELEAAKERTVERVETPFAVEYARKSRSRGYAPTLVPVSREVAGPVIGATLVLRPEIDLQTAKNLLYRRDVDRVGEPSFTYDDARQRRRAESGVRIVEHRELAGVALVLWTEIYANIDEVREGTLPAGARAEKLADLAIGSLQKQEVVARGATASSI